MATGPTWACQRILLGILLDVLLMCHPVLLQAQEGTPQPIVVSLMHTNDLHSRFRPENDALRLGGIARIKTAVDRIRAQNAALLIDGGDWSEGGIYYNLGAGIETLQMMDQVGYDVGVVGNHDGFNGPEHLVHLYSSVQPRMKWIGANFLAPNDNVGQAFRNVVPPFVICELSQPSRCGSEIELGLLPGPRSYPRIAFIGVATYEFIYDPFFSPVKIFSPFTLVRDLAAQLKNSKKVDAVVVVSHNQTHLNEFLLKMAPSADLVIGGHDHLVLREPVVVSRAGAPHAWVVEAGYWGQYLGKVDLKIVPNSLQPVELFNYELIQIDSSIPEDPTLLQQLNRLETELEHHHHQQPIFHDHLADSHIHASHRGAENLIGNLTTDAYRAYTGADLALDQIGLIYGEIYKGPLHTVDFYHVTPAIYSPITEKSWTLKTFQFKGRTLKWLLNLLYGSSYLSQLGMLSTSGLQITYSPLDKYSHKSFQAQWIDQPSQWFSELQPSTSVVREIRVGGQALDLTKDYRVAIGGGISYALDLIRAIFPKGVPVSDWVETNEEAWRVLASYVQSISPLTAEKISIGDRVKTVEPDLAVLEHEVTWTPLGTRQGHLQVRVWNFGATPSPEETFYITPNGNLNGMDTAAPSQWIALAPAQKIPAIPPQGSIIFEWSQIVLPLTHPGAVHSIPELFPIQMRVNPDSSTENPEVNLSNNISVNWVSILN